MLLKTKKCFLNNSKCSKKIFVYKMMNDIFKKWKINGYLCSKHFPDSEHAFSILLKVLEFCSILPGSNATVKRIFSLKNNT